MKSKYLSIFLMVAMLFVLAACGQKNTTGTAESNRPSYGTENGGQATTEEKNKYGGKLVYALSNDVDGLDPHRTVSASTFQVTNNIFDTLIGVTPKGELVPRLAKEWHSSEDGLTWTFSLQENVKFHNGRMLTADDVVYSFHRLKEKGSPRAKDYANIIEVKADGENKVIFSLGQADATFLSSLAMPWTAIVAKEADADMKNQPIGTGPYKLVEWVPQQSITLQKNENYFVKGKPYLDEVTFQIIPEATTLLANLQSGTIDIAGISGEQVDQIKNDPTLKVIESPMNNVQVLALNNKRKPLDDVRVRQAISMAINKQQVIDGANWGYGQAIGSHMAPTSPYYVDTTQILPYDLDKAKSLLKEAGYEKGFSMKLSLPEPYKIHVDSGQIIADQLKKIGINLEIEMVEWGKWVQDVYTGRNYDMTIISHTGRLDPDAMLSRYQIDSGENYFNYENQEVDKAIKEAKITLDEKKRRQLYEFVQKTLAKEVPAVYIQAPYALIGMKKLVQGYEVYPIDIIELSNIYLEK